MLFAKEIGPEHDRTLPEELGDFGGVRTKPSVEYDCIYGIANGIPPTIGDHFHPRGDLNREVMALDKAVYAALQPLQPWIDGAEPVVEMANVMKCDYPGYWWSGGDRPQKKGLAVQTLKAATRVLCDGWAVVVFEE